jgi:hypothetical protein
MAVLFFYFNQRPLSLYCVWKSWINQEVRLHSPLNEEEDGDLISPVQMPVEFTILFSIIETPTTNQGKRGSMSYIVLFHWQPFKAIIYFSVWFLTRIWLFFIPLSSHQSHREDIAFLNSWLWFSNSSFSHGILNNKPKYEHKYQQIKLHSVFKMFLCLFWWIWGNYSQQFIEYLVTMLRQVVIR